MSASRSPTITVQGPDGKPHIIHSDPVGLEYLLDCLQGGLFSKDRFEKAASLLGRAYACLPVPSHPEGTELPPVEVLRREIQVFLKNS